MKSISKVLKTKAPKLDDKTAEKEVKKLQELLSGLQRAAWGSGQRTVIAMEGFDAAGKGGCIRHITARLDPRGCKVVPISAPTEVEKGQHYLQRFWKQLPNAGDMVIFDRSWYGRVLVEKVEEFAEPNRIRDAYREINAFERMLEDDGIILIKIFLVVSKAEQLARFQARIDDPLKNWKITEEDVRNRKRWNDYVKAGDVALKKCPGWYVIPSDDKDYARVEVLKVVVDALKARVKIPPRSKKLDKLAKQLMDA